MGQLVRTRFGNGVMCAQDGAGRHRRPRFGGALAVAVGTGCGTRGVGAPTRGGLERDVAIVDRSAQFGRTIAAVVSRARPAWGVDAVRMARTSGG